MAEMQCPRCRYEFKINIDISIRNKGLSVFRGRMVSLGKLDNVDNLFDFLNITFSRTPEIRRDKLIGRLVNVCRIPREDAIYIIGQFLQEGMLYENGELLIHNV